MHRRVACAVPAQRPGRFRCEAHRLDPDQSGPREPDGKFRSSEVNDVANFEPVSPVATDGEIAAINFESARRSSWRRFLADPRREGLAEAIVEEEMLAAQYLGDLDAL